MSLVRVTLVVLVEVIIVSPVTFAEQVDGSISSPSLHSAHVFSADHEDVGVEKFNDDAHGFAMLDAFKEAAITFAAFVVVLAVETRHRIFSGKTNAQRRSRSERKHVDVPTGDVGQQCSNKTVIGRTSHCDVIDYALPRGLHSPHGAIRQMDGRDAMLTADTDGIAALVRRGRAQELPQMLDTLYARMVARHGCHTLPCVEESAVQHLTSAIRACAAQRRFREALVAYDHVAQRIGRGCDSLWSLLLYSATEVTDTHRGKAFFAKLRETSVPSVNDITNVAKCCAHDGDAEGLRTLLNDARVFDWSMDATGRNRVMAAFVQAGNFELVEEIAAAEWFGPSDIVTYNMLMKCNGSPGKLPRCFELYQQAKAAGLEPTDRTFGILLDCCAAVGDAEKAKITFQELLSSGLPINVVLGTTYLKCLISADQLDEAEQALETLRTEVGFVPDLITYSTLMKGYAEKGRVLNGLRMLEKAAQSGIALDAVICNVLLGGCAVGPMQPELVSSVLSRLLRLGFQPSCSTLSMLVKVFSLSGAWQLALSTLEEAPKRLGVKVKPRVYEQLAHACGQSEWTLEVYAAMVRNFDQNDDPMGEPTHTRLRRICSAFGDDAAAAALKIYRSSPFAQLVDSPKSLKPRHT